ncbi:MAG TPA: alpha/beta hydrolase [Anaerolineales bacterium]|nr:alpha/beta hydrolase [Anaerolineales bacterium]
MDIKEYDFDTGLIIINYAEIPSSGIPLVLLHGGNARWQAFGSILAELTDWHIYAPDFRGHGKSGRVPNSYRLQDYTDDIIAFLRETVHKPAYLFGHSLGGIVGLMVAAQYPTGISALVVGDAPLSSQTWRAALMPTLDRLAAWRDLSGGQKSIKQVIDILKDSPMEVPGKSEPATMREMMGDDSPFYEWLATSLYQSDPDMLTAIIERFDATAAGYEMNVVLPAIQCPVLLLQADPNAGGLMTDAEVEQALQFLARPIHMRLEEMSHVLHNDRKEPVVSALKDFFQAEPGEVF